MGSFQNPNGYTCYTLGMKTAVSIPNQVFDRAEAAAQRLHMSRSQLYAKALEEYLKGLGEDPVTAALDALAQENNADSVPNTGRSLIEAEQWQW